MPLEVATGEVREVREHTLAENHRRLLVVGPHAQWLLADNCLPLQT